MNAVRVAAADLLGASDPLSDTACIGLLSYREEDDLVDFKRNFDPRSDKSWIDLAVDCVAFANTAGGYVVFGVADRTWDLVGLGDDGVNALADTKKVAEKLNRNLIPALTRVRTRVVEHADKRFVILCSPCSPDCTHIFESNLDWAPAPGKTLTLVTKGAIYTRRVASNQVLTAVDFELVIGRRLNRFRDKILEGLVRVVKAPAGHEVVTVVQGRDATGATTVTIGDAPLSLNLKGKPLKLASDSLIEKVGVFQALTRSDKLLDVPARILYEAYVAREGLDADVDLAKWLAYYSLISGAPVFFWLDKMNNAEAREVLESAFVAAKWRQGYIVTYSGFYGEKFYAKMRERLVAAGRPYARVFRNKPALLNVGSSINRAEDSLRATALARSLIATGDQSVAHELERLDCALYAPFD